DRRSLRRLVRLEVRGHLEPLRVDPFRVGDDGQLRGDRVAEEVDGRGDRRVRLQRPAFAHGGPALEDRQARGGRGREDERERGRSEEAFHATAPRHIWRRSAQRRNAPSISPRSCVPTTTGSQPSERKSRTREPQRDSWSWRRRAASLSVTYTGKARPLRGSAYATVIPPTSGKLRSQTGSWMITGTSSHRCSRA